MYQNDLEDLPKLTNSNFENALKVLQDDNGFYYYNLLETLSFPDNLPDIYFIDYVVKYGDTWPLISYNVYNDITMWWIIAFANKVINPITFLQPGKNIKVPVTEVASEILTQILTQVS
jgi:nucleoid-associated protein YgaU